RREELMRRQVGKVITHLDGAPGTEVALEPGSEGGLGQRIRRAERQAPGSVGAHLDVASGGDLEAEGADRTPVEHLVVSTATDSQRRRTENVLVVAEEAGDLERASRPERPDAELVVHAGLRLGGLIRARAGRP